MKKLIVFLFAVICIFMQTQLYSQVSQEWVETFTLTGGSNYNVSSMVIDNSGNTYIAGSVYISGYSDYLTLKYNSSGVLQWYKTYNGTDNLNDYASAITIDGGGNVYVTGYSFDGTVNGYVTLKYSSDGTLLWSDRYNCGDGYTTAISIDGSGNIYVTGSAYSVDTIIYKDPPLVIPRYRVKTIKYNPEGILQWSRTVSTPQDCFAYAIAVDASGNVIVTGGGKYALLGNNYITIKYDSDGVTQWFKSYNGTGNGDDVAVAIAIDASGDIYVTGSSDGSGTERDYVTVKYSSGGAELWVQRYNSPKNISEKPSSIALDASGNVYVTGYSHSASTNNDYTTIKYSPGGTEMWVRFYNGTETTSEDYANAIKVDAAGNIYVTGSSQGSGTGYDFATVKYNSGGEEIWAQRYTSSGYNSDDAEAIGIDGTGNIYITGCNDGSIITIKYSQTSGPVLLSPDNNSIGLVLTPVLQWNAYLNATGYNLQVAEDQQFSNLVVNQTNITATEYLIPENLLTTNTLYFWRVNAIYATGISDWSGVWNFTTYATPQQNVQMITETIDSLEAEGILDPGNATALETKLALALDKINKGQYNAAINILNAFINQVQSFINENILTPEQGQNLLDRANALIEQISGDNMPEFAETPKQFRLYENYPNPFNPVTKIKFDIPLQAEFTKVRLTIYDLLGREVKILVNDIYQPGSYEINWDASGYSSGIYFYRIETAYYSDTKRMVLLK